MKVRSKKHARVQVSAVGVRHERFTKRRILHASGPG